MSSFFGIVCMNSVNQMQYTYPCYYSPVYHLNYNANQYNYQTTKPTVQSFVTYDQPRFTSPLLQSISYNEFYTKGKYIDTYAVEKTEIKKTANDDNIIFATMCDKNGNRKKFIRIMLGQMPNYMMMALNQNIIGNIISFVTQSPVSIMFDKHVKCNNYKNKISLIGMWISIDDNINPFELVKYVSLLFGKNGFIIAHNEEECRILETIGYKRSSNPRNHMPCFPITFQFAKNQKSEYLNGDCYEYQPVRHIQTNNHMGRLFQN